MTLMPAPYKSKCIDDWTKTGYNVNTKYDLSVNKL